MEDVDIVGVHVRRTDHLEHEHQFGYQKLSKTYYIQAMNTYRSILRFPVYVFVSDDNEWVQSEISQNLFHHSFTGNIFSKRSNTFIDSDPTVVQQAIVVPPLCEHYGT